MYMSTILSMSLFLLFVIAIPSFGYSNHCTPNIEDDDSVDEFPKVVQTTNNLWMTELPVTASSTG